MTEFTGTYEDRMLAELVYLSMALGALDSVHKSFDGAIGLTEPALQSAELEFRRLLQQNILFIEREVRHQVMGTDLPSEDSTPASGDLEAQSGAGEKGRL